jgi:hypothetical protein
LNFESGRCTEFEMNLMDHQNSSKHKKKSNPKMSSGRQKRALDMENEKLDSSKGKEGQRACLSFC